MGEVDASTHWYRRRPKINCACWWRIPSYHQGGARIPRERLPDQEDRRQLVRAWTSQREPLPVRLAAGRKAFQKDKGGVPARDRHAELQREPSGRLNFHQFWTLRIFLTSKPKSSVRRCLELTCRVPRTGLRGTGSLENESSGGSR